MSPETPQPGADFLEQKDPFKVRMPKKPPAKWCAAASQLENGLIRTLQRKPQMEKDYTEFMQKILDKGYTSPVPPGDIRAKS